MGYRATGYERGMRVYTYPAGRIQRHVKGATRTWGLGRRDSKQMRFLTGELRLGGNNEIPHDRFCGASFYVD